MKAGAMAGLALGFAVACGSAARAADASAPAPAWTPGPSLLDTIVARKQLRIGLPGDYKPYGVEDAGGGTFSGIDVDLATGLAQSLGAEPIFVKTSWATLLTDFKADRFDMVAGGVSITLARQRIGLFSIPTDLDGKAAIARCADAAKYGSLDLIDKPEVRVVVNPGGTNEAFDRSHLHAAQIRVFPDNRTIFREIAEGRADVMITDGVETRLQQKLNPGLCAIHPDQPYDHSEKGWLLPRDPVFKAYVDQYLHTKQLDGTTAAVEKRWLD